VNEGVMIQVFASKDRAAAEAIRKRLRGKGYTALLVSDAGSWKVRVGPYADREEAEKSAVVLREQENLKTWIP
jgi:cell division septation protein DedD